MARKRKLPDGMVTRPGRKGYYADFRIGGRRIQKKLGRDFEAAKTKLIQLRARTELADFGLVDNQLPLVELRAVYLRQCQQSLRARTVETYTNQLKNVFDGMGINSVAQVSVPAVLSYREKRLLQGKSPRTVNAEVQALGGMLNWAADQKPPLIGNNPILSLRPLRHDHPKEGRPLTTDEVTRLLDASPPHWRDLWYAFLVTGTRESELASLLFSDVDFDSREIVIRRSVAKNHAERRIPMDDALYAILRRRSEQRAGRTPGRGRKPQDTARTQARFSRDHVFVTGQNTPLDNRRNVYRAYMACCARAGIQTQTFGPDGTLLEHVDLHSLRRTFTTEAIISGADPKTVQDLLGHKTLTMTMKVYTKIRGQTKRQAIGRLPYGQGVTLPEHLVEMPVARTLPVQNGDGIPATAESKSQVI